MYEIVFFQLETLIKVTLEKFSDVIWRCWRYIKASPDIALRVREKMMVVRRVDQEICNWKWKNWIFKIFNSQNIPTKLYESVFFQLKILIKVTLEKFSDVVWRSSRYLKASPNIALRVFKKKTVVRRVDREICN